MGDHSIPKGQPQRRPALHDGGASKWDMKEALLSRAKVTGAPSAKGRATKVSKVGRPLPFVLANKFAITSDGMKSNLSISLGVKTKKIDADDDDNDDDDDDER